MASPLRPEHRIRLDRDAPSEREQLGLCAAASDAPAPVSPDEERLLRRKPRDDANDDELMEWRMQLFAARQANPTAPPYIYSGKIIRPTRDLPTSIRKPIGLRTWLSCPTVEMFNVDESLSLIEQDERTDYDIGHTTIAGLLVGTTSSAVVGKARKRPPLPTSAAEFYTFAQHLSRFMVATNRWDADEAELHSWHVHYIMDLFEKYPVAQVLLYEADFRATRHRLQDRRWNVPDQSLFQCRLQDPLLVQVGKGSTIATSPAASARQLDCAKMTSRPAPPSPQEAQE